VQATQTGKIAVEDVPTTTLSAYPCLLGEGAGFDASRGIAVWCDILGRSLFEADVATGAVVRHDVSRMPSEVAATVDGRQLLAMDNGLHLREPETGRIEPLCEIEAENRHLRSNDGRVHASGAFWIGTMSLTFQKEAGSIYWYHRGELRRLFEGLTVPNATAFTADGRTGYFIDSPTGRLKRVAVDPRDGLPEAPPEDFFRHEGEGVIDGAVVDAAGTLWCAINGGGAIHAISPEGELKRRIRVPARQVTCPAFVGAKLDRLMVTTAGEGITEEERRADPLHGQTFLLTVGATGSPEPLARPLA
jgi:sugar lactone lactonase